MGYIPKENLKYLEKYKYSGVDKSLLSRYVLCHWWNSLIKVVPMWVAPNLLTLTGFCFILFSVSLAGYYSPDLSGPLPNWCYYVFGVGLFLYQSLDAIDGKQARRVGASGPLGELFDHGCDALNTTLSMITAAPTIRMGGTWLLPLSVFCGLLNFYLSTWEEYHTGTLYLGYFSGPVDGVFLSCIMFIFTGWKGSDFWITTTYKGLLGSFVPQPLSKVLDLLPDATLSDCFVLAGVILIVINVVNSAQNVFAHRLTEGKPIFSPLLGMLPYFIHSGILYLWLLSSPHIVKLYSLPLLFYITFAFGYSVGLIILAHVVKLRFPYVNVTWIASIAACLNGNMEQWGLGSRLIPAKYDFHIVCSLAVFSIILYLQFALSVINVICKKLDIWCLRIKHKQVKQS
ncbi:Choline/ethanolaminephosphotransferase [Paraphysoderma sedebokerense]|nr:Choline/ethanolaminephosphotransferase [Paraphysoderma sedebokerense]